MNTLRFTHEIVREALKFKSFSYGEGKRLAHSSRGAALLRPR